MSFAQSVATLSSALSWSKSPMSHRCKALILPSFDVRSVDFNEDFRVLFFRQCFVQRVAIGAAVVFRPVYQRSVLLTVDAGVSLDVVDDVADHRVVRSVVVFVVT